MFQRDIDGVQKKKRWRDVLERMGKGKKELTNKIAYEEDELLKGMQCLCRSWILSSKHSRTLDEICDGPRGAE